MFPDAKRVLRSAAWSMALAVALSACGARVTAPPEPPSSVRRGDDLFRYEEYDAAIVAYRSYLDEVEYGDYTARAFYKEALAQYRLKQYHESLKTLDELTDRYPRARWVQVEALRGDDQRDLGNSMMALQAWDRAWTSGNESDHAKLRQRILGVSRHLNDVELARARRLVNTKGVGQLLDNQITSRQAPPINEPLPGASKKRPAKAAAAEAAPEPSESAVGEAGQPIESPHTPEKGPAPARPGAPGPTASRVQVAAVPKKLPTPALAQAAPAGTQPGVPAAAPAPAEVPPEVGEVPEAAGIEPFEEPPYEEPPYEEPPVAAPVEEAPVQGITKVGCLLPLSGEARSFGRRELRGIRMIFGDQSDRLIVKDTTGDPARAVGMFEELSSDPTILAVIGPLGGDEAEAVAAKAAAARVPLFLLSQRDGLTGPFVLQAGMTRGSQVATLLSYAMDKVRLRRFGVLYPKDTYGAEFLSAFRSEVQRRGGTLVGAAGYDPRSARPETEVDALKRWRAGADLQAVFLPDSAPTAAHFAKFLQNTMPDVTLLGVHGWETLAEQGSGATLSGILFADGFYAGSTRPATREFVERFQQTYGTAPELLEAQSYDAALLVKRALDATANSRSDLLHRLQELGAIEGATGPLYVTPGGLQRRLYVLQVADGKLQEIGAAPSEPAPVAALNPPAQPIPLVEEVPVVDAETP
jgi:ABC-type branched-subunit amino acid transport system substrate-binding protein